MSRLSRILAVGLAVWTAGIAEAGEGPARYPYHAVCTVGMVSDIVGNIAGDKARVEGLIGDGVDPHLYQATRTDVTRLIKADVIFYSGLLLEGKMTDSLIKVARKRPVFAVTELIDEALLIHPEQLEGHYDPHVWMAPPLWKKCAEKVANALAEFDPANAAYYRANYEAYAARFDALDAYARRVLSSIPEKSRVIVTAHDAFNYLGRTYGLEVKGIQGISTESEAGIDDINRLVSLLVDRQIRAVFVETSVSDKNVRSLLEGAKARGHEVVIGGKLFSDAMGGPGTYEGTYIGMIDHNITTIARALGGEAPEKGMQGKLAGRK